MRTLYTQSVAPEVQMPAFPGIFSRDCNTMPSSHHWGVVLWSVGPALAGTSYFLQAGRTQGTLSSSFLERAWEGKTGLPGGGRVCEINQALQTFCLGIRAAIQPTCLSSTTL